MKLNPHTLSFPAAAQAAADRSLMAENIKSTQFTENSVSHTTDTISIKVAAAEASEKSKRDAEDAKKAKGHSQKEYFNENKELTETERTQVEKLKARDKEVKQHEQAHLVVAGQYAVSGASYNWQQGPDGKKYAVGGEVQIDTSEVPEDPRATINKMEQVKRAALAPVNPSTQDYQVAARAENTASQARAELTNTQISETNKAHQQAETNISALPSNTQHTINLYLQQLPFTSPSLSIVA